MTHDGGSDDRPTGSGRPGPGDAPGWSRLLAGEATAFPADLGAAVDADELAAVLRREPGLRLCEETDGSVWLAAELDAGGAAAACVLANFLWSLVYQHGAPAVLLLEIASGGTLTAKVHERPGEPRTYAALALLLGARRLARRCAPEPRPAEPPRFRAADPASPAAPPPPPWPRSLRPETVAQALTVLPAWQLCPAPDGDALAAVFSFPAFLGPWVLWNLAAPALLAAWPDVDWMIELGPTWVAFALRDGAGGPPGRRLLEAARAVDELAAGLQREGEETGVDSGVS